ncbi:hypothetical protein GALMADRAFT_132422 [Galerina marginata CBS 339.88]|uniref:Uncharacterized protein n=1 Tax=Galerina marginata (strain CBS 339.88) TaxID=685588 RepID=A0A067U2Y5_GALM3|nr:hypothetical protein GALMADRAFT_132422 [Galerina marginata CBS 339.88]
MPHNPTATSTPKYEPWTVPPPTPVNEADIPPGVLIDEVVKCLEDFERHVMQLTIQIQRDFIRYRKENPQ